MRSLPPLGSGGKWLLLASQTSEQPRIPSLWSVVVHRDAQRLVVGFQIGPKAFQRPG